MVDRSDKLTILCITSNAVGHVNAALGITFALKQRNHRVVFVAEKSWRTKFSQMGFEEEIYEELQDENKAAKFLEFVQNTCEIMKKSPCEQAPWVAKVGLVVFEQTKFLDKQLNEIVERVKPDIAIIDYALPLPSLIKTNKPLVYVTSTNPLQAFNDERLPPWSLGLPLVDKTEWTAKRKLLNEAMENFSDAINEWLEKNQLPKVKKYGLNHISTNLNVYIYPKPVAEDYWRLCPLDEKWLGLDHSIRESNEAFKLPENFTNKGEKLIYLSMGTIGCVNVELMSRLCKILAKCKHKIIVARGFCYEKYELAENMWGEPYLPQIEIIPLVDLVIFHGGNNSFIETLYFAKPMIMMPLLWDQHDNAERMVEMNIGVRLNPFTVDERELLSSIDCLLNDSEMAARLKQISNHMKQSKSMDIVIERIEKIAKHPIIPTVM